MIDLRQGDCLEVLKTIPDKSVDCIITSPPYWKGFEYEAYFNSYKQYLDWCKIWLSECKRVLKPNGTFYLNVINDSEITIRAFEIMEIATRELMWKLHDTIIWYRYNQQPANTNRQLTNQCEYIFMLRHTSANVELYKQSAYNNCPEIFKTKNVGNVWELPFNSGKQKNSGFGRKETTDLLQNYLMERLELQEKLTNKENDHIKDKLYLLEFLKANFADCYIYGVMKTDNYDRVKCSKDINDIIDREIRKLNGEW